jgi:hypothetical protein
LRLNIEAFTAEIFTQIYSRATKFWRVNCEYFMQIFHTTYSQGFREQGSEKDFWVEREKVTGGGRILHNKELHICAVSHILP